MFTSVVFAFDPTMDLAVRGSQLHGWFMRALKKRNPQLATRLHGTMPRKPFSIALIEDRATSPSSSRQQRRHSLLLRITSLDSELSAVLPTLFEGGFLAGSRRIVPPSRPIDHPVLTGWGSAEEILEYWRNATSPSGRARFRFVAPTGFAKGRDGQTSLFPTVTLTFKSLAKTWLKVTGLSLDTRALEELLSLTCETAVNIHTHHSNRFVRYPAPGVVGSCEFVCPPRAAIETRQLLHLLADFAFFASIGTRRTMGMGHVVTDHLPEIA